MDDGASISADCSTLYFTSNRSGGVGSYDLWQVSISPVVDFNGDGIVDCADMCIMVDHWGEDYPLCDIGPTPLGDGIVDVQDLIVLAEHLFEGIPQVEPEEVNVDENDDGSQVELEQGQILVVTLESNPTTGYRWEVAEIQESILEQMGEAEFKPSQTGEPPMTGAGGWEIFRFKAISAGQMTLQLVYRRSWEEGVEPINTFSLQVVVR
jgi:inhibitor of cysteine peptidase